MLATLSSLKSRLSIPDTDPQHVDLLASIDNATGAESVICDQLVIHLD